MTTDPVVPALDSPWRTVAGESFALWAGQATVAVADSRRLAAASEEVRRVVAAVDDACSSFRQDSELSVLNAAAGAPVVVGRRLFTAVREALRAARRTGGAVDPTVAPSLVALGFTPRLVATAPRLQRIGAHQTVRLDETAQSICLPRGVSLDLGATAKALAADDAAHAAATAAGCGVLVSLCGDVACAGAAPPGGWKVRVTDDHRRDRAPGQTVTISAGGLATSSTVVRRDGRGRHHLIDPGTGRPAHGPWRTVSVTAGSCLDANTASTAAIVLGSGAPAWLRSRGLPARLVGADATVRYVGGWPSEGDDL